MSATEIRGTFPSDASQIAPVHLPGRQVSYRGIAPQQYLLELEKGLGDRET